MLDRIRVEREDLWDIYTRKEEYDFVSDDPYKRFAHRHSGQKDILVPLVSREIYSHGFRPFYPGGKKFAVCLTHDIDNLFFTFKSLIRQAVSNSVRLKYSELKAVLKNLLDKKDNPYYKLNKILELEAKYGAVSSFFFLSLKDGEQDFNYSPDDIPELFEMILKAGCEVGLHTGHGAYNNFGKFISEKKQLDSASQHVSIGNRNHFLNFKMPESWGIMEKAGIKLDTTFGYHDQVGFRNGMCYPYRPYDLNEKKYFGPMEIPLVIMDCTLDRYMGLDRTRSLDLCKKLVLATKEFNGVLTFLWHNNYDLGIQFYADFLGYCSAEGAWLTSGERIYNWWTEQKYLDVYTK